MYRGAHEELKAVNAITDQSIVGATVNGADIDTDGFESGEALVIVHVPTAVGAAETVDIKMQDALDSAGSAGTYADIPNQTYTQLVETDVGVYVGRVNLVNLRQWVRVVATVVGTVIVGAKVILTAGKSAPVTQENAVLFNIATDLST